MVDLFTKVIKKQVEALQEQMANNTAGLGRLVYFMYARNNFNQG